MTPLPQRLGQEFDRDGALASTNTLPNGLTVNIRMGRLDDMPRCKACGRAICSHPDPVFQGLIPLEERR